MGFVRDILNQAFYNAMWVYCMVWIVVVMLNNSFIIFGIVYNLLIFGIEQFFIFVYWDWVNTDIVKFSIQL